MNPKTVVMVVSLAGGALMACGVPGGGAEEAANQLGIAFYGTDRRQQTPRSRTKWWRPGSPRRRRNCRERGKQRGDLHRAAQGPLSRHQGAHLGRRRAGLLRKSGNAPGHRRELAGHAARLLAALGAFKPGDTSLAAGRLGTVRIAGDNIILGTPFTFTKANVDQFNF